MVFEREILKNTQLITTYMTSKGLALIELKLVNCFQVITKWDDFLQRTGQLAGKIEEISEKQVPTLNWSMCVYFRILDLLF